MYFRETLLSTLISTLQTITGSGYSTNVGQNIQIADGTQFDSSKSLDVFLMPTNFSYETEFFGNSYVPIDVTGEIEIVILANSGSQSVSLAQNAIDDIWTCLGRNLDTIYNTHPTLQLKMNSDAFQIMNDDYQYVVGNLNIGIKYTMQNFNPSGSL